jgi:hypothetical protein
MNWTIFQIYFLTYLSSLNNYITLNSVCLSGYLLYTIVYHLPYLFIRLKPPYFYHNIKLDKRPNVIIYWQRGSLIKPIFYFFNVKKIDIIFTVILF